MELVSKEIHAETTENDGEQYFFKLGLKIKSIREDENEGKLYVNTTVNCKISSKFDLDNVNIVMNKAEQVRPDFQNSRLSDDKLEIESNWLGIALRGHMMTHGTNTLF